MRDEPRVYFSEDGGLTFPRYTSLVMGLVAADIDILVMDPLRLNCTFAAYGRGSVPLSLLYLSGCLSVPLSLLYLSGCLSVAPYLTLTVWSPLSCLPLTLTV